MKVKLFCAGMLAVMALLTGCSKTPKVESYSQDTVTTDVNGQVDTKTTTDVNGVKHTTEAHSTAP